MLSGSFNIRGLDWWIGLDCVGTCKWQGLTTSKTMAKCDIAATWGRAQGAFINYSFVAVFGTPLSIWRTIQLSNIWKVVYRTYWDRRNRPGVPHCNTQDQSQNLGHMTVSWKYWKFTSKSWSRLLEKKTVFWKYWTQLTLHWWQASQIQNCIRIWQRKGIRIMIRQ